MRLEHRIPPPLVGLACAAAMWVASDLPPGLHGGGALRHGLAGLLAALGFLVAGLGVLKFRALGTTIDPTRPDQASTLAVDGIYRFTRNPMYLGFALMLLAWATALGAAWSLAGPPLFVWYIGRFQIAPEERVLRARFGAKFDAYAARVRRWL